MTGWEIYRLFAARIEQMEGPGALTPAAEQRLFAYCMNPPPGAPHPSELYQRYFLASALRDCRRSFGDVRDPLEGIP